MPATKPVNSPATAQFGSLLGCAASSMLCAVEKDQCRKLRVSVPYRRLAMLSMLGTCLKPTLPRVAQFLLCYPLPSLLSSETDWPYYGVQYTLLQRVL